MYCSKPRVNARSVASRRGTSRVLTSPVAGPDCGPTLRERRTARQRGVRSRSTLKESWTRKYLRGHGTVTSERVLMPGARARPRITEIERVLKSSAILLEEGYN
ncbi:hypothetical protein NDU88_003127 [Pleurodeles waltl]|uniref:Uncharacterized protein n=1 Tax=Pleurodeles waltl TaxID=8319 RepID=A0AAV7NFQ1_PLEWA|nr:hypothetical protein NDU88_003127 [Pleurodeles waltl]